MARQKVAPRQLSSAFVNLRAIPQGVQATLILVDLKCSHASGATVEINFVPSGDAPSDANQILEYDMVDQETRGFFWRQFLNPGDSIRAKASSSNRVTMHLSVLEEEI